MQELVQRLGGLLANCGGDVLVSHAREALQAAARVHQRPHVGWRHARHAQQHVTRSRVGER